MAEEGIKFGEYVTLYYYGYKGEVQTEKGIVLKVDTSNGTTLQCDNQDVVWFSHSATQRVVAARKDTLTEGLLKIGFKRTPGRDLVKETPTPNDWTPADSDNATSYDVNQPT